jgi:hypothetical protein
MDRSHFATRRDVQVTVGELVMHHDRKTAPQLGHVAA